MGQGLYLQSLKETRINFISMIEITTDTILNALEDWVKTKTVVDAHTWIDAAQKLNVLIGNEHDLLYNLEQEVAKLKVIHLENGNTVAKSTILVAATDIHRVMMRQRAKIRQIEETIRISKIQAKLKDSEYRNQQ